MIEVPCDHTSMGKAGVDREVVCPGCGATIGKFTVNGKIYTTKAAADAAIAEIEAAAAEAAAAEDK